MKKLIVTTVVSGILLANSPVSMASCGIFDTSALEDAAFTPFMGVSASTVTISDPHCKSQAITLNYLNDNNKGLIDAFKKYPSAFAMQNPLAAAKILNDALVAELESKHKYTAANVENMQKSIANQMMAWGIDPGRLVNSSVLSGIKS